MAYSHSYLVNKFEQGKTQGNSSSMFIEGDTLYSYGHHFPLLMRREFGYIQNGDKYSASTSGHQSCTAHLATVIVPFSSLRRANITPQEVRLVSKQQSRYDTRTYKDKDGVEHEVTERRPESCLLEQDNRYFLSSMDNWAYFLVELPAPCQTVDEALEMLIPDQVKGKEYQRQGEWFIVKAEIPQTLYWSDAKGMYNLMVRDYILPHRDNGNQHVATRGCELAGKHYISGQLHHPEHRMLRLSTLKDIGIFEAYENNAVNSWSVDGRVD